MNRKQLEKNLPEGWEIKQLRDIAEIILGGTPNTNEKNYWDGDILWCTPTDITGLNGKKYIYNTYKKISQNGLKNSSAKIIKPNSILLCTRATLGECAINKLPITTNQGFKNISLKMNVNVEFVYYYIIILRNLLKRLGVGTTFLEISKRDIERLYILLPPLPEQKKIAEILSTWDDAIDKTESLIEAKTKLKKGLMQKLLTGKIRFEEFRGQKWEMVKLKNHIIEVKEKNVNNAISNVLSITNHSGFIMQKEQFSRLVASKDLSNYKIVKNGMFAYNPSRVNVGSLDLLENFDVGILSPMYIVFKANENNLELAYLKQFYKFYNFFEQLKHLTEGSVRDSLSFKSMCQIKISLFSLPEQKKIASVLSCIDKEIELWNTELDELKKQKKGLMQRLLTGKIRVKL